MKNRQTQADALAGWHGEGKLALIVCGKNPDFSVMIDAPADENQRFPGHVSYQGIASAMPKVVRNQTPL
jgi:hypothetical protein